MSGASIRREPPMSMDDLYRQDILDHSPFPAISAPSTTPTSAPRTPIRSAATRSAWT